MKKFLAVVLAVTVMVLSVVPAFAVTKVSVSSLGSVSLATMSTINNLLQFDTGNNNYIVPVSSSNSRYLSEFFDYYNHSYYIRVVTFSSSEDFSVDFVPSSIASYSSTGGCFNTSGNSIRVYYLRYNSLGYYDIYSYNTGAFSILAPGNNKKASYVSNYSSNLGNNVSILDVNSFSFVDFASYVPPKSSTYTLTVNYLYSEDNPAADPVTQELSFGEEYSIPSPEIEGYTPSIPLVTGTMPDEDLTIDVYYTKAFYPLTVKYQYQNGSKAAEDVTFQYPMGFSYDIPSPEIEGYTADKPTVTGTMPGRALEEVVTYSPIPYTLSIFYQFEDGTQAAETHREQLTVGAAYLVTSPTITGYKSDSEMISGTMPAKDIYFTVVYKPDLGGGSSSGGSSGGGDNEGDGDNGDGDDDNKGGGDSGGGSSDGGWTGNDPFIPSQPPFSGYDPFDMSGGLPDWLYCPFHIRELPSYTYDPFAMPGG